MEVLRISRPEGIFPEMRRLFLLIVVFAVGTRSSVAQSASTVQDRLSYAGRCQGMVGPDKPPLDGSPFIVNPKDEWFQATLPLWKYIGYRLNPDGTKLLDANGDVLSAARAAWLNAPADFSKTKADTNLWMTLIVSDWSMVEKSCQMQDFYGRTLTRLQLQGYIQSMSEEGTASTLENLQIQLKRQKLSAEKTLQIAKARLGDLRTAGVRTPAELDRIFTANNGASRGAVSWMIDRAYARQTMKKDSWLSWSQLWQSAKPYEMDFNFYGDGAEFDSSAAFDPQRADRPFGKMLGNLALARFKKNTPGRELINNLTDYGRSSLPEFIVEKHSQSPADSNQDAAFARGTDYISVNHWALLRIVLADLPVSQRAMRVRELSDPTRLRRYLEAHPGELERIMERLDELLYHELTHTWQMRRTAFSRESGRGNAPGSNPLSREIEAYRSQCRYALNNAAQDPRRFERIISLDLCLTMLSNYKAFQYKIQSDYLSKLAGSQPLLEIRAIQDERQDMALRLQKMGGLSGEVQTMKLAGYAHGDVAIKELETDAQSQERDFLENQLPDIKELLIEEDLVHKIRADYGVRLGLALYLPENEIKSLEQAFLARPLDEISLQDRITANQYLQFYYRAKKRPTPYPALLTKAFHRDAAIFVNQAIDLAAQTADAQERDSRLANAKQWAALLPLDNPAVKRYRLESSKKK